VKKVNKPQRKKIVNLEEKKLTLATGSSGYMVSWGFEETPPGEGGNP
jgi:hypothetical protein